MDKIKKFLFTNTNTKQTIIKNTFWLFLGEFTTRFFKLIIFIIAARLLTVNEWGVFSYAIAMMTIFVSISDLGINAVIIKNTALNENKEKYLSTSLFLKTTLSILTGILFFIIFIFSKEQTSLTLEITLIMIGVLFLDNLREFGYSINRAFQNMQEETVGKIITAFFLLIGSLTFLYQAKNATSLTYAYLFASFLGFLYMQNNLRKYSKIYLHSFSWDTAKNILTEAWPLAIASTFTIILGNIDTIILGLIKTSTEVGIYSSAQKPAQLLYLVPSLFSMAILPILTPIFKTNDKEKKDRVINQSINVSIILMTPVILLSLILSKEIIYVLFGKNYQNSIEIFKILISSAFISTPGIIFSTILFAQNKQKKTAMALGLGVLINIVLCIVLIPKISIKGAAWSFVFAQIISNLFIIFYAIKYNKIKMKIPFMKILIASLPLLILFITKEKYLLLFTTTISTFFYFIILIKTKEENTKILIDKFF